MARAARELRFERVALRCPRASPQPRARSRRGLPARRSRLPASCAASTRSRRRRRSRRWATHWHWRLDDDSRLGPAPVGYEPFALLARTGALYGYVAAVPRRPSACAGVGARARTGSGGAAASSPAARAGGGRGEGFFDFWPENLVFYTNFEISHASVWQSAAYRAWMADVDAAKGVWTGRWGDAPIRALGLALQRARARGVHRFSDIAYAHAPFVAQPAGPLPGHARASVLETALCGGGGFADRDRLQNDRARRRRRGRVRGVAQVARGAAARLRRRRARRAHARGRARAAEAGAPGARFNPRSLRRAPRSTAAAAGVRSERWPRARLARS